jgi:hypothetical protein
MNLAVVHAADVTTLYAKLHRVATESFEVCGGSRRKSALRDSGSVTQFFAEMKDLDAAFLMRGRDEVCNPSQAGERAGSKYELRSGADWRAHDSLAVAAFHCRQHFWLNMRPGRRVVGALVRPALGVRASSKVA